MGVYSKFLSLPMPQQVAEFLENLQKEVAALTPGHYRFVPVSRERLHLSIALFQESVIDSDSEDQYFALDDQNSEDCDSYHFLRHGSRQSDMPGVRVTDRGLKLTPERHASQRVLANLIEAGVRRVIRGRAENKDFLPVGVKAGRYSAADLQFADLVAFEDRTLPPHYRAICGKTIVILVRSKFIESLRRELQLLFQSRPDLWVRHNLTTDEYGDPVRLHVSIGRLECHCAHEDGKNICQRYKRFQPHPRPSFPYDDLSSFLRLSQPTPRTWTLVDSQGLCHLDLDLLRLGPLTANMKDEYCNCHNSNPILKPTRLVRRFQIRGPDLLIDSGNWVGLNCCPF